MQFTYIPYEHYCRFYRHPGGGVGNEILTDVTMTRLGSQSSVVQEALGKPFER